MQAHRVVVVGGGFGGLPACRILGGEKGVDVTLLDRRNHHLFQPLLYHVATGILSEGEIAIPFRHVVLRRSPNVKVELAEVTGFDLERGSSRQEPLPRSGRGPLRQPDRRCRCQPVLLRSRRPRVLRAGMKTLDDALELRRRIFGAFEMAEVTTDAAEKKAWLTFVVVGAGPTGVELAGQIRELAVRSLKQLPHLRSLIGPGAPSRRGKEPLATFGDKLSGEATKMLEHLGVELKMGLG